MAQFATAAEFANRLGVSLTASEITDADALLVRASALIQAETGQDIEEDADDELTRRGTWDRRLRLPQRPVQEVSEVTLDGEVVAATSYYLDGDELVRTLSSAWGGPEAELVVTYSHGYASTPEVARTVCLEAVARVWVNPGSVLQEGYGSEQVTYQQANGVLLTEDECNLLRDTFRRHAAGVQLR